MLKWLIAGIVILLSGVLLMPEPPVSNWHSVSALQAGEGISAQSGMKGKSQTLLPAAGFDEFGSGHRGPFRTEVAFYETLLSYGANQDPRNTFLLVNAYVNTQQQARGIAFFEKLLSRFGDAIPSQVRAHYLTGYAILRATWAESVALMYRIPWVLNTINYMQEAEQLTNSEDPLVHWGNGLIYSQLPFFFFKKDEAYRHLNWIDQHPETEPVMGFYREAYYTLSELYLSDGNSDKAGHYLAKSGYDDYSKQALFMAWFSMDKSKSLVMAARETIEEIVPGRVFALYGFGFSDVYFVISKDGNELIAIDAGTDAVTLQNAYRLFTKHVSNVPQISTLILTHAHWDHIGGFQFFKELNADLQIIGNHHFATVKDRVNRQHSYHLFRGPYFDAKAIESFKPTTEIKELTTMTIGGTEFELIPTVGGETEDAMLVNLPALSTMFVGDILMPYYGEPWVEEGHVDEASETIQKILDRAPQHVLHGHRPLTLMYQVEHLKTFKPALEWLVAQTKKHIEHGYSAQEIIKLNLIPPGLQHHPEAFISYLAPMEHVVKRVADSMLGIWQENSDGKEPQGLHTISSQDYTHLLVDHLHLSESQTTDLLESLLQAGENEMALVLSIAAKTHFADSDKIRLQQRIAGDRLRSINQFFDPFKFTVYGEMIGASQKPMPETAVWLLD